MSINNEHDTQKNLFGSMKKFVSDNQNVCAICGEKAGFVTRKIDSEENELILKVNKIFEVTGTTTLCKKCYKGLELLASAYLVNYEYSLRPLTYYIDLRATKKSAFDEHEEGAKHILMKCPEWTKQTFLDAWNRYQELTSEYNNYHNFCHNIADKIYNAIHANKIEKFYDMDLSTWTISDGKINLYMYGNNFISELRNVPENHGLNHKQYIDNKKWLIEEFLDKDVTPAISLNLNNIVYFKEKGDIAYTSQISGGDSKGVNAVGTIIGALTFGDIGALIGSRVGTGTNEIRTETIKHDNRYIGLMYRDDSGEIKELIFTYEYYKVFMQLLPEKEYYYVNLNSNDSNGHILQTDNKEGDISIDNKETMIDPFEEIRKYKELLDEGIITQDEFKLKKKELLGL